MTLTGIMWMSPRTARRPCSSSRPTPAGGATSADTDFLWMEEGGVWSHVASNTPFKLTNRSHERRKLRFVISPNLTQVFPGGTGTRVLAYTITLREIE